MPGGVVAVDVIVVGIMVVIAVVVPAKL